MQARFPIRSWLVCLALTLAAACGSGTSHPADSGPDVTDPGPVADVPEEAIDDALPRDVPGEAIGDLPQGDVLPDAIGDVLPDIPPDQRDKIFVEGCPVPGRSFARQAIDPAFGVDGPDGIGTAGDFLMANGNVAYVIEAAEHHNAYYLYGGILVDAVAVNGCRQAGPERFQELGIMMGTLDIGNFVQSVLRAFRADRVEVVADGSDGGPAIVRATGADDTFWLVEDELIHSAYSAGQVRPRSTPLGIDTTVDYVLAPDSNVLEIRVTFTNQDATPKNLLCGCQTLFGVSTRITYYSDTRFQVSGFNLQTGVPWMVASSGDGAWAFAMDGTDLATMNISGVTALLDLSQIVGGPLSIGPKGDPDDAVTVRYFVATGPTDPNSAVRHLQAVNPTPIPDMPYTLKDVSGTVVERDTGAPIGGATIDLEALNGDGQWRVLDGFVSGDDGRFAGRLPDFGAKMGGYRLIPRITGRPVPDPVTVDPAVGTPVTLAMDRGGTVCATIIDDTGKGLPARVYFYRGGILVTRMHPTGVPTCAPIVPNTYDITVTHGFEYTMYKGSVTVTANQSTALSASLSHVVDTTGYLNADTHCHAAPSPDNVISIPERIATVAAEGLEVVVATDHEAVSDWSSGVEADGLQDWVATVIGEEVTATMPEHMTMLGAQRRLDIDGRGGIVRWYGLDMAQSFDAIRARGARVVGLNHPQGWITDILYDTRTGTLGLKDPTRLGFPIDAQLFSFNMDMIELMNGPQAVFNGGKGMFDYWTSFLNLGHRITAVGSSDAHDYELPGVSRTYFPSPTDSPSEFNLDDLVVALKGGRVLVSLGGFARVEADGTAGMGDTVTDVDGEIDLAVHIEGMPDVDMEAFRVYVNCDEVLEVPATSPNAAVKFDGTVKVPVTQDAHVVVMGFGRNPMPTGFPWISPNAPRFVTNPIYVDVDGNGVYDPPGGKTCTYNEALP